MDWFVITALIMLILSGILVFAIKLEERRHHQKSLKHN